ncbi:MAG: zeta toxin family protein [Gemmataceae bacterium]|nr:zeta toxin family protein [Gemmataceae bacterium]
MDEPTPTIIVLAGPNGAGKTTSARTVLAETLRLMTFVNADVIAQGLAGFDPESAAIEASRLMLERLHTLAGQRASFAFETTLAARSLAVWLAGLRQSGYAVHLAYFWLNRVELAIARVAQRVQMGGHGIPEQTIRQRYQRSVRNFFTLYRPVIGSWKVYDNSQTNQPELIAKGDATGQQTILNATVWDAMRKEGGDE